jgi:hypothetical protein
MIDVIKTILRPWLHLLVSTPLFSRYMGWRRSRLKLAYISSHGNVVASGPFAGMRLHPEYSELPKFLGAYEATLYPAIQQLTVRPYDIVLNIGCAEGYYAVGFARAMPNTRVLAFDTDSIQRARCRANIQLNSVSDRVSVDSHFDGKLFNKFVGQEVLVICDIEGGEIELIRPERWHGLEEMDFLIELHEDRMEDIVKLFRERFRTTHELTHMARQLTVDLAPIEKLFTYEMDQLTAIYENRFSPTSWLLLLRRKPAGVLEPSRQ